MRNFKIDNKNCNLHRLRGNAVGSIMNSKYSIKYFGCPDCFDALARCLRDTGIMPSEYKKLLKEIK